MKKRLTQSVINSIKPNPTKPIWITDEVTQNLRLYVGTSGKKVWYVRYLIDGKERTQKLGVASDALTVAQAREMADKFLARIANGEDPKKKKRAEYMMLGEFLTGAYEPWAVAERKSGKQTVYLLRSSFQKFLDKPIADLNIRMMEKWRQDKMSGGTKAATCNRRLTALKAALNWAVKREYIDENPIARLEKLQEHDSDAKVRYLRKDERTRLMSALDAREEQMRRERNSHNEWLKERDKPLMPALTGEYTDHIKPMVLFALNTGIRRGALFSMQWGDIDFNTKTMLLRAAISKSGKTERLPLNKTAIAVLKAWRKQSADTSDAALVFPSPKTGKMLNNVKKAWAALLKNAQIENFRWHDMRHDFASQLVMRGVDLNTVRELMGHSDMKMTLRYAHLAPENKLRAVELLDE